MRGRAGQRGCPDRLDELTVVYSDNSPGRWCYLRALDGRVTPAELSGCLDSGALPVLYAATREESRSWTYGEAMSARDKQLFSLPQLKHCPIEDALDGAPRDPRIRALRNLCPMNHFLFPMPSKFAMARVGWSENPTRSDLGESQTVIAWVQHRLLDHIGGGASVYERYLRAVGGRIRVLPPDGLIEIRRKGKGGDARKPGLEATRPPRRRRAIPAVKGRTGGADWWSAVLAPGRSNPRAEILGVVPDARQRLERLLAGLTVEKFVGISNAMFNKCDPKDLEAAAPRDLSRQAELGWGFLAGAKQSPALGGKWVRTVDALCGGAERGLVTVAAMRLDAFVTCTQRVVSQVYRKV